MQNHRCPLIPEIVTHIFKNLLDDSEYSSLCQLARTTKSFTEPALDLLWRSQSSLAPLVCCLPDDAIYKIHYEKDYGLIKIRRVLIPKDLHRVRFYAGRIRGIYSDIQGLRGTTDHLCVDAETVHHLLSIPEPLLVNLNHLRICLTDFHGQAVFPRLVVGRSLQNLNIEYNPDDEISIHPYAQSLWSNVSSILSSASQLHSLTFLYDEELEEEISPNDAQVLLPICRTSNNLRKLAISPKCDLLTLQHLSTAKFLQKLDIQTTASVILDFLSTLPSSVYIFETLMRLEMETDDLSAVQSLLNRDGFACMHSLYLNRKNPAIHWDIKSLFIALGDTREAAKIKRVRVADIHSSQTPSGAINAYLLSPLFRFTNMTTILIDMNESVSLDNLLLNSMVTAWPRLQTLALYDWRDPTVPTSPSVTLSGMIALAHCHDLTHLALRVNAYQDIPDISLVNLTTTAQDLKSFCVCRSPTQYPDRVKQFLQTIFPNLVNLSYGYNRDHTLFASIDNLTNQEQVYFESWRDVWRQLNNGIWE